MAPKPGSAHVIVLGNEKGGSGKSTVAVHIIVSLIKSGYRVASIDTDSRQLSLTRYLENRSRWARKTGNQLELPTHFSVKAGDGETVSDIQAREHAAFREIVERLVDTCDFVIIDTPANDTYRMRLSHAMADTLITPINDSFIDLDVLGRVDPADFSIAAVSQYAELVREERRKRHLADYGETDWVVVRNRLASLTSRNEQNVIKGLREMSEMLEFRIAHGVSERVIFRELFPIGLTVFDPFEHASLGVKPTPSHVAARHEVTDLIRYLNLPVERPVVEESKKPAAAKKPVAVAAAG